MIFVPEFQSISFSMDLSWIQEVEPAFVPVWSLPGEWDQKVTWWAQNQSWTFLCAFSLQFWWPSGPASISLRLSLCKGSGSVIQNQSACWTCWWHTDGFSSSIFPFRILTQTPPPHRLHSFVTTTPSPKCRIVLRWAGLLAYDTLRTGSLISSVWLLRSLCKTGYFWKAVLRQLIPSFSQPWLTGVACADLTFWELS